MPWANIAEMISSQHTHMQDKTATSLKKRCISPNCQYILNTIKKLLNTCYHCFTAQFWDLVHLKNKPVILRHLVDKWFTHLGLCPRGISHISPRGLRNPYKFHEVWTVCSGAKDNTRQRLQHHTHTSHPRRPDFDIRSLSHFRVFFILSVQQIKRSKSPAPMKKMHKIGAHMRSKGVFNFIYILLYHRGKWTWLRMKPATGRKTS